MSGEHILIIILLGVIASWLAGQIVSGTGYGMIHDLIIGVLGALFGGWLLPQLHVHLAAGLVAAMVNATIGATLLPLVLRLVRNEGRWSGGWGPRWRRRRRRPINCSLL
jgi:uncharacterized membrane protein YeaQ/YmgE (transglycosylase-associated protein family)